MPAFCRKNPSKNLNKPKFAKFVGWSILILRFGSIQMEPHFYAIPGKHTRRHVWLKFWLLRNIKHRRSSIQQNTKAKEISFVRIQGKISSTWSKNMKLCSVMSKWFRDVYAPQELVSKWATGLGSNTRLYWIWNKLVDQSGGGGFRGRSSSSSSRSSSSSSSSSSGRDGAFVSQPAKFWNTFWSRIWVSRHDNEYHRGNMGG